MCLAFIANDDIPAWSGHSTFHDGNTEYELKYGKHEKVSIMQAMLGQGGPTLEARSGSCLVIAVCLPQYEAGLLIHIWRDEDLSDESAELIQKPFKKYPQLTEQPNVYMLTSERLNRVYPRQVPRVKALIESITNGARFKEILATDNNDKISVSVELDTRNGRLIVMDDFGDRQDIQYDS